MGNFISTNGITAIYNNFNPAFDNLYKIELYDASGTDNSPLYKDYISFHATSVSLNEESLQLERNAVTKNFTLPSNGGFTRVDTITITWRENEDWEVKKYHDEWLARFYNKDNDCYYSYPRNDKSLTVSSLTRNLNIIIPKPSKESSSLDEDKDCMKLKLFGVFPNTAPGVELGWKASGGVVSHSITYYVTSWKWED